jgi:hypothetical protein
MMFDGEYHLKKHGKGRRAYYSLEDGPAPSRRRRLTEKQQAERRARRKIAKASKKRNRP